MSNAIQLPTTAQDVAATSRFDPTLLLKLVRGLEEEFRGVQRESLEDAEDEAFAANRLRHVRALGKQIDGFLEELKRPHLDALAKLRELGKPFQNLLALGVGAYGGAIEHYRIEQARERAAALEAARESARVREAPALAAALNAAEQAKPQRLEGVSAPLVWQVDRIEDMAKVNPEWLITTVDIKALNQWAGGQPVIDPDKPPRTPGVVFKLVAALRVRT